MAIVHQFGLLILTLLALWDLRPPVFFQARDWTALKTLALILLLGLFPPGLFFLWASPALNPWAELKNFWMGTGFYGCLSLFLLGAWRVLRGRYGQALLPSPDLGDTPTVGRQRWFWLLGLLAAMLLYSWLWLFGWAYVLPLQVHPRLLEQLPLDPGPAFSLLFLLPVFLAPFWEEVIYRAFFLDKLLLWGKQKALPGAAFGAVFLSSALWACGHTGMIQPDWVKAGQIFGIGLLLGWARFRLGLGACILLHLVYNGVGGLLVPPELRPL